MLIFDSSNLAVRGAGWAVFRTVSQILTLDLVTGV